MSVSGEWAGELINPPKSYKEVAVESKVGKDLYVKSHASWDPGEQMNRQYDWSSWDPADRFGEPTPCNERGVHMKAAMYWQAQRCMLVERFGFIVFTFAEHFQGI